MSLALGVSLELDLALGEHHAHYARVRRVADTISRINAPTLADVDSDDLQFLSDALQAELQERGLYETEDEVDDNPF